MEEEAVRLYRYTESKQCTAMEEEAASVYWYTVSKQCAAQPSSDSRTCGWMTWRAPVHWYTMW